MGLVTLSAMRVSSALLLCGLVAIACANSSQQDDQKYQERQQNLLQLFVNVQQPNYNQQQQQAGNNFNFNPSNFNNAFAVKQFQQAYEQGFLPRGQVFNYNNPNHLQQAIHLFDLFYFAKDFNTFYQAACWARDRVNEGQFVYALSVAIAKRADTQSYALPPQSEVYPQLYVNTQAVQQAQNYKQQGQKQASFQSNNTNNYVFNQQQKHQQQQEQQQQQQGNNGNQYQPFKNQNQYQNNQYQNGQYQNNQNQANQYQQYGSQYQNQEGHIAYFTEDVNLNQQFANQQVFNPNWFNGQKYNQKNQRQQNGESFYYYLQQILARYNLERYANRMPAVQPFQFNQKIQPGYNPQLQYHNGQQVPARPANFDVNNANADALQQLKNIDRRLADAVDSQTVKNENGGKQALNADNGVEILGNIVQNNEFSANQQYYGANNGFYSYFDVFRKVVGSVIDPYNHYQTAPGAVETNAAALRDPAFYQIISRIVNYFQNFKNQQKPYNGEQLNFAGVKVQNVKVDKLVTYFDNAEVDLYNAINYGQNEQAEQFQYKAKQPQLNSRPFNYNIQVQSEQEQQAIVRVFVGPQFDAQGNQYNLEQARQHFVEIDRFTANLKNGQNQIQRNSAQSSRFVQQQPSTRALFSQQDNYYYNQTTQQQQQFTFPQNLILPKGSSKGQQYVFAVAVNQYQPGQSQSQYQNQPADNRPQGFPFDRPIQNGEFQRAQNIYFQAVTVYNKPQSQVNEQDQ